MSEIERIHDLSKRAVVGGAWYGPALLELLDGVDAARASARPIPGAHTIWEIVLHVAGWEDVARRRLEGEPAPEPDEGDWPEVAEASEAAWREAVDRLAERGAALRAALERLDPARLDEPVSPGHSSAYATAHGQLQHTVYHAGQIAVLKRG